MKRKRKKKRAVSWGDWFQCSDLSNADGTVVPIPEGIMIWRNDVYTVMLRKVRPQDPFGEILWLSIKRNDREVAHDWRDMQRIKTELVGAEFEAVELYPAESRHVDTANQYHLWVFASGYKLPFGFTERVVAGVVTKTGNPDLDAAKQRPFNNPPDDLLTSNELAEKFENDKRFGARMFGDADEKGA